jgi:DNA polymerase (family X)
MPIQNSEIADIFNQVAALLEIDGANTFRIRAYQNAALRIASLSRSLSDMVRQHEDLTELEGIGKDLAAKIEEIVTTGHLGMLEEIERRLPPGLLQLLRLPGLGPKRVRALYQDLKITTLAQLAKAAERHQISQLPGFGEKLEAKLLQDIQRRQETGGRILLSTAESLIGPLLADLQAAPGVQQVTVAGSFRRRLETVGDVDILATALSGSPVMDRFTRHEDVRDIVSTGATRSIVHLRSGLQVDVRVVPEESYGAALHYFTGSKAHNIAVRRLGQDAQLKVNEYGVFRGRRRIAGRTEEEVYRAVGLPYIEPELREMRGELAAARAGRLPRLIRVADIRGDLHAHTDATDGHQPLAAMVQAAQDRGYAYLAVTDHSQRVTVARGLDEKRLRAQLAAIDRLNAKLQGFTILKGIEVDILEDGGLDLPDSMLRELDLTVCSVHSKFNLSREKQTERIVRAMDNPNFKILGHPTGRLLGERPAVEVDMEALIRAAQERGVFLELNSHPQRLDLADIYAQLAKEAGVKLAISTDAHHAGDFESIRYGVDQARRGWIEPEDVINTRPVGELKKLLKRG